MSLSVSLETVPPSLATNGTDAVATAIRDLPALENRLAQGFLEEWNQLVAADPYANLFQTPGWCMPWYRCYRDTYDPFVIVVRNAGDLVGLVPMAVERASGRLVFASDSMADYRDIVALPEHRKLVVEQLVETYLSGGFLNSLQVGWLDPASDTRSLVEQVCRERGLRFVVRQQPCYRWFPPPPAKPSAQKFLNWFKRQGTVSFDVIESNEDWAGFRDEYYQQHSLRYLQTGRDLAFDDPRRTALYEQLFQSTEIDAHVTAFRLDGQLLAGHFGYVWRGVLLLGPPVISLEHEQRSPAVILLAWIIQNAGRLGLSGFDLTIGDAEFKRRLGNVCVRLTQMEVFASNRAYLVHSARREAVAVARGVVAMAAGEHAWRDKVKPAVGSVKARAGRIRELGWAGAIGTGLAALVNTVHERRTVLLLAMTPDQLRRSSTIRGEEKFEVHDNRVEDLLRWRGSDPATARAISACVRGYARLRRAEGSLHTITIDGQLAGWTTSHPEDDAERTLTVGPLHVVPQFRGRDAGEALLSEVLVRRFAEGAVRACTTALEVDRAARHVNEAVGFQLVRTTHYERFLNRRSVVTEPTDAPSSSEFESYLGEEWLHFSTDGLRQQQARAAVEGLTVSRVLDLGCGGGQDLIPFATVGTTCVGVDVAHESGIWATRQFSAHYPDVDVRFITSAAEHLPFPDEFFDLVLCRVAIPYTDNRQALAEIARVLRPGGVLLLKTHSARYYLRKFADGVRSRSPRFSIHAVRVLLTGLVSRATGRQPRGGLLLKETFQSSRQLQRDLGRVGMSIERELPDSNPLTPSYKIVKVRDDQRQGAERPRSTHAHPGFRQLPILADVRAQLRRFTWINLRRRVERLFYYKVEERIYRMTPAEALELPASTDFGRDCWEHLERFVSPGPPISRDTCLTEWRRRLAQGEHVFTRVEDGRLVSYGWLVERQKVSRLGWTHQTLTLPDRSAVIYDFYTLPEYRNRDFYQRLLMHVVHEAGRIPETRWVYVGARGDDTVPRWWVERLGFSYCDSYFRERVLWREKKWQAVTP